MYNMINRNDIIYYYYVYRTRGRRRYCSSTIRCTREKKSPGKHVMSIGRVPWQFSIKSTMILFYGNRLINIYQIYFFCGSMDDRQKRDLPRKTDKEINTQQNPHVYYNSIIILRWYKNITRQNRSSSYCVDEWSDFFPRATCTD